MSKLHLDYTEYKALVGDLGVTNWTKYNWLSGPESPFFGGFKRVKLKDLSWNTTQSRLFSAFIPNAHGNPDNTMPSRVYIKGFTTIDSNSITGPLGPTPSPDFTIALNSTGTVYVNIISCITIDEFLDFIKDTEITYEVQPELKVSDIINMDLNGDGTTEQYRIIKNPSGSIVEVVAMSNAASSAFGSTQVYENSTLDTYLNTTWYNTLTDNAKNAIVPKTFKQQSWYTNNTGNPDYSGYYGTVIPGDTAYTISLGNADFGNQITRHVYALGVQDVLNYVLDTSITDGQLQNYNILRMFWNDEVLRSSYPWCRDANAGSSSNAMLIGGSNGRVGTNNSSFSFSVRPAFQIDLSKITYTKEAQ